MDAKLDLLEPLDISAAVAARGFSSTISQEQQLPVQFHLREQVRL